MSKLFAVRKMLMILYVFVTLESTVADPEYTAKNIKHIWKVTQSPTTEYLTTKDSTTEDLKNKESTTKGWVNEYSHPSYFKNPENENLNSRSATPLSVQMDPTFAALGMEEVSDHLKMNHCLGHHSPHYPHDHGHYPHYPPHSGYHTHPHFQSPHHHNYPPSNIDVGWHCGRYNSNLKSQPHPPFAEESRGTVDSNTEEGDFSQYRDVSDEAAHVTKKSRSASSQPQYPWESRKKM